MNPLAPTAAPSSSSAPSASSPPASAPPTAAGAASPNQTLALTVNGRAVTLTSPPDTPLLWALRDELHLVGVKFGCGAGLCGACTIILNGQAARACQTLISDVAGAQVQTIEGMTGPVFEAVVAGWIKAQAPQCGYCQPGFVSAVTATLTANPAQTRDAVLSQISNLCRCGTYDAIREAIGYALDILQTPPPKAAADKPAADKR